MSSAAQRSGYSPFQRLGELLLLVCCVFLYDLGLFSLSLILSVFSVVFYCSYKCCSEAGF